MIGKIERNINISNTYLKLSQEDESAASELAKLGKYRVACYLILQSMEKLIRSKIFSLINADNDFFRDENRNHSIESAFDMLINILSTDNIQKEQIRAQFASNVLLKTNSNHLHNNLRYPYFQKRKSHYVLLNVDASDYEILVSRLNVLKSFIKDIHLL